ncbi:Nodulin MtN3 family protein [Hibiscus syriacus]|uniref:non-specific serine/threonine protein kinase n=1 Tax=Hibiscus syriacus TaxID=106335 RepID=A0A6A2ZA58_HIBSY|nr:Nodulin MtN3 family protein [Hibiscus syriacus]
MFRVPGKSTSCGLCSSHGADFDPSLGKICGFKEGKGKSLGRGSADEVYKGRLPSGQVVAIKHIKKGNSLDTFAREVMGLSRIRHPNLISLLGCCIEGDEQYFVLEYCHAGNLAQHLLRKDCILTWDRRVKILRDCTWAEMLGMKESKVFTDVRGTIGYMDPEYMTNAKLTCASDIYSFGIVALQILSGQKVIELDLDASEQLTRKATDVSLGKRPLTDFEDPRLHGDLNRKDFKSILHIAVLCVAKSSRGRPLIDIVFDELDKAWKNTIAEMKIRKEIGTSAT